MAGTLMQTYLAGRDAGQRVAERTDRMRGIARTHRRRRLVLADLRGFTSASPIKTPEQVIPLLNDYADVIVSAITAHGR